MLKILGFPWGKILLFLIFITVFDLWSQPHILYLNSYQIGYKWSDDEQRGFLETLESAGIRPSVEFLDVKRYPHKFDPESFSAYLNAKYADTPPELLVAADDAAFEFLLTRRKYLFPGASIVFCGVNFAGYETIAGNTDVYGVSETPDVADTLELMGRIHPDKDQVAIVADSSLSGRIVKREMTQILAAYRDRFEFIDLTELSPEELLERAQDLPDGSLILYTFYNQDPQGRFYPYDQMLLDLKQVTDAPIWGTWDFQLGKGIIGGKLISGYAQGVEAAEIALRLLAGEALEGEERLRRSPNGYAFDYTELKRHSIRTRELPRGSRYINRPDSLLVRFRAFLLSALGLIVGLLLLSAALAVKNRRIQAIQEALARSEEELKRSNILLEEKVRERTEELQESLTRLQEAQEQLVESEKLQALGRLVAGISHELNTPIGVALTAATHLKRKLKQLADTDSLEGDDGKNLLRVLDESSDIVERNIERSAELVRSFKSIAADQFSGAVREYAPVELAENLLLSLKPRINEAGAQVEIRGDQKIKIVGDPGKLLQILTNLLTNALDHGVAETSEKRILISIEQIGESIELRFRDSGLGIAEADKPHIFEPFFTTKRGSGGTGLGLHIVHNLVTSVFHGSMSFESGKEGTEFTIRFPRS